jgi:hypothetical protein
MCYFVTVGISSEFASTLHYHVRNECSLTRNNNPTLAQYFGAGEVAFDLVTGKQPCSCALYFDSNQKEPPEAAMRRLKYRKKGWAAEKVDRVIAEEFSIYKGRFQGRFDRLKPELRQHVCNVVRDAGRVLLIVHWYSESPETEELHIKAQKSISCDELLSRDEAVAEDVLIEVIA